MRDRAYNAPVGYQHPAHRYVVTMRHPSLGEERSWPLAGSEVDRYVGFKHRSGWTYVSDEQVPG